jgi:hypothetical protein
VYGWYSSRHTFQHRIRLHHTPHKEQEDAEEPRFSRLKLESVRFNRTPSGKCSAVVELRCEDGSKLLGMADGHASALGELRLTAEATLRALKAFLPSAIRLEVLGVKPLRVFDANIIIVAIGTSGEGRVPGKLLGTDLADIDPIRATAKAVLNATNRLVYSTVASRV